jgi:hypothetical protein
MQRNFPTFWRQFLQNRNRQIVSNVIFPTLIIECFPASNVFALVKLAHLYQFQSLLDRCELHLMNCVEIPLIHRLTCANFYGLKKLKVILNLKQDSYMYIYITEPSGGEYRRHRSLQLTPTNWPISWHTEWA